MTALLSATIERATWDAQADADADRAAGLVDAPEECRQADRAGMPTNLCAALNLDGRRVGTLVYEIDAGVELFVVALVAHSPGEGIDLLTTFHGPICDLARASGCKSIRYGTSRPGMVRKSQALGYRVSVAVMRLAL